MIQWFPGHMVGARRDIERAIAHSDVVVEVLDARIPIASVNPVISIVRLARQRPCLRVLNKADLADPEIIRTWLAHFAKPATGKIGDKPKRIIQCPSQTIAISCNNRRDVARIPSLCQRLAPHRSDASKPLRLLILGIPNVGKSTLMNALSKRYVARVGDEPAVTKSVQRIDLTPRLVLMDTPGLMWPKITEDRVGLLLAACHTIGANAVPTLEVARFLVELLWELYPQALINRYEINVSDQTASSLLESIALKRAGLQAGGRGDSSRAAHILLSDFRSGALGRLCLESPQILRMCNDEVPQNNQPERKMP